MRNVKNGFADVDNGKLYYEMAGDGETLVLCHAGFLDRRMWDDQWTVFAEHYRVIRFDMRGYGKSNPADGPVCRRQDAYGLLKALGVTRAILLGCSMGGEALLDLTLEHPEIAAALVVVSAAPSGFQLQGEPPRYLKEMMGAVQQGNLKRASELQIRIWVDGPLREPEQVNLALRRRAAEMNLATLKTGTWGKADMKPLNPLAPPAVGRLGEIRAPTLVIAGALDDPEILRAADILTNGIAGVKKVIIPNTAHVPSMEAPEAFNQAVLGFLDSLT